MYVGRHHHFYVLPRASDQLGAPRPTPPIAVTSISHPGPDYRNWILGRVYEESLWTQ